MILFRPPSTATIESFLARQKRSGLSYRDIGATAGNPPERYVVDRTVRRLGSGEATFDAAVAALRKWKQFDLGWVQIVAPRAGVVAGEDVAIIAQVFGIWWLNGCRIVYVEDEATATARRFAFAYGTLADHVGEGEERFAIEMDEAGVVTFNVSAFSRPRHVLSRLAYPLMRAHQKQFGREAADAMQRALAAEPAPVASPV
ncbi:MAG TPA: DUF1990 domain-containing protein [Pirellulaceae bacterium]|jgi:uncharacterized protein (UPF0548 family)|nr:DUF1990 domain-containing protein [Pirellulaceae bacterium]